MTPWFLAWGAGEVGEDGLDGREKWVWFWTNTKLEMSAGLAIKCTFKTL